MTVRIAVVLTVPTPGRTSTSFIGVLVDRLHLADLVDRVGAPLVVEPRVGRR